MGDGSYLAFFEAPEHPFEFKDQHDFDLHIALEVDGGTLQSMFEKGKAEGVDTRGVIDHGFVNSIYFRDPNGYVIELTAKTGAHDDMMDPEKTHPRQIPGPLAGGEDRLTSSEFHLKGIGVLLLPLPFPPASVYANTSLFFRCSGARPSRIAMMPSIVSCSTLTKASRVYQVRCGVRITWSRPTKG